MVGQFHSRLASRVKFHMPTGGSILCGADDGRSLLSFDNRDEKALAVHIRAGGRCSEKQKHRGKKTVLHSTQSPEAAGPSSAGERGVQLGNVSKTKKQQERRSRVRVTNKVRESREEL